MQIKGPSHDLSRSNVKTIETSVPEHFSVGCAGSATIYSSQLPTPGSEPYLTPHCDITFIVGEKEVIGPSGYKVTENIRLRLSFDTWEEIQDFCTKAAFMARSARKYERRLREVAAPEGWHVCEKCKGMGEHKPETHMWRDSEDCKQCKGTGEIANGK